MTHAAYLTACAVCFAVGWWLRKQLDDSAELRRHLEWNAKNAVDAHACWRKAFRNETALRQRLHKLECACLSFSETVQELTEEPENQECDSNS